MHHQRVSWHHDDPDQPVVLYSEIDGDGWETRKVDEYRDGRLHFADAVLEMESTWLADQQADLTVEEINAQPEFSATSISGDEFEEVWSRARSQPGPFTLLVVPASTDQPLKLTETQRVARTLVRLQAASHVAAASDPGGALRISGSASAAVAPEVLRLIAETVGVPFRINVTPESRPDTARE